MSTRLPTASALDRAVACPASAVLPQVRESSVYAERGHGVHDFIVDARDRGRNVALAAIPLDAPHRRLCEALPLDELPSGGQLEVAVAWDYTTDEARVLPSNGHRDYSAARPTEFVGTADMIGVLSKRVIVPDWKSGYQSCGPAKTARQLRLLSLAGARLANVDEARVGFFYLHDDGSVYRDWAELDAVNLSETAAELRELVGRIEEVEAIVDDGKTPDVTVGSHCDFCPCMRSCPAFTGLARHLPPTLDDIAGQLEAMTPDQLAESWEVAQRAKKVIDDVQKGIKRIAKGMPIDLDGGKVLKEVQWPGPAIDAVRVREVLTREIGEDAACSACQLTATKGGIENAIRAVRSAAETKKVMAKLEAEGAITTVYEPQVRAVKK